MSEVNKTAYFYWGYQSMSFLRYLSVFSFAKFNPDWKIQVFVPVSLTVQQSWIDVPCNKDKGQFEDEFPQLHGISNASVNAFDMNTIGFPNNLSEVHKSDILRLWLLAERGGLWSDVDILYFGPIGDTIPADIDAGVCYRWGGVGGPAYHSIGFLYGKKGNPYFKQLFNNVGQAFNPRVYQSIGSYYYCKYLTPKHDAFRDDDYPGLYNFDIDTVYPCRVPSSIFRDTPGEVLPFFKDWTIGLHWYAGAGESADMQRGMSRNAWEGHCNILSYIIRRFIYERPL